MRILKVITPITYGGGENQIIMMAKVFREKGFSVKVLNTIKSEEFESILNSEGIEYMTLTNYSIGFSPTLREYKVLAIKLLPYIILDGNLRKLVRDFDIVWSHGFPANWAVALMKKMRIIKNTPLIYTHHSTKSPMKKPTRTIYEKVLDTFNVIVGVSSKTANSLVEVFPKLKEKITFIPNGIDTSVFNIAKTKEELRKELNLPLDARLGIYVARFAPFKNHIFLLKVLSSIPDKNFKMVLLGDGPEFSNFKEKAKIMGLEDRIICLGYVPNKLVPLYLKASDFCLYPSLDEGFGVAIVEAMAAGLPVVVFKSVYVPEFGNNIKVASDEAEFIEYAKRFVYDRGYASTLGKLCQEDAKKLDIRVTCEKYIDLLSKLREGT